MFRVPEQYRLTEGTQRSDGNYGNNGCFVIPYRNLILWIVVSDGLGWEHVSVSLRIKSSRIDKLSIYNYVKRCPTWEEMCFIKDLFWGDEDCVIQYHPPKSEYINNSPFCLHLWKSTDKEMPIPESILVGIK